MRNSSKSLVVVYKHTVHDGPVSYSVTLVAPEPGKGKHAKSVWQVAKRHKRNRAMNELIKGCLCSSDE